MCEHVNHRRFGQQSNTVHNYTKRYKAMTQARDYDIINITVMASSQSNNTKRCGLRNALPMCIISNYSDSIFLYYMILLNTVITGRHCNTVIFCMF